MDTERARTLLTDEKDRLDDVTRRFRDEAPEPGGDHEGSLGRTPGDYGTEVETRMEDQGLAEEAERRRHTIDAALERIEAGTWGTCTVCGATIDDERLEALPDADRCREHADTPS